MHHKRENLKRRIAVILFCLAVLACMPPCVTASDTGELQGSFTRDLIPVSQLVKSGDTILVKYQADMAPSPDALGQDIPYILGTVTREYPSASTIRIDCFVGNDPVRFYEVSAKDIRNYAAGKLSDGDIRLLILPKTPDASMITRIKSSYPAQQGDGTGIFQSKGVLVRAWEQAGRSTTALLMVIFILVVLAGAGLYAVREFQRGS